jgi:hypothetical protein
VQVGDKVFIRGWKHLFGRKTKPRKFGFIERIDGGYHYVRPTGWPKDRPPFELYECEFKVVRRYNSGSFKVGDRVTITQPQLLNWGKCKPRHRARVVGIKGPYIVVSALGLPNRQFDLFARQLTVA